MLDQAGDVRAGEQLDAAALRGYLLQHLPEAQGDLTIQQFGSGYSNLTYLLRLGPLELILRRPPFGNQVKSAHDMGREYRVLSHLHPVFAAAPQPLLYCDDTGVIGDEFYVMQRCQGVIFRGPQAPPALANDPHLTRQVCESLVDQLVALHALDYDAAGLGDLGKPDGYVARQINGWTRRYEKARTHDWAEMDQLALWLTEQQPSSSRAALIHNDYKYDNVMLDSKQLTRIVAVLDWEMATIGDPLMDLGTALAYWVEADDPAPLRALAFGPTMAPGSLTRQAVVDRYTAASSVEMTSPLFYYAYGIYKLAAIVQQIYVRYVRGHTRDVRFAQLDQTVACLAQAGMRAVNSGTI
jgi:aminoglycoside phosphotransferase (APT) family kinase protein